MEAELLKDELSALQAIYGTEAVRWIPHWGDNSFRKAPVPGKNDCLKSAVKHCHSPATAGTTPAALGTLRLTVPTLNAESTTVTDQVSSAVSHCNEIENAETPVQNDSTILIEFEIPVDYPHGPPLCKMIDTPTVNRLSILIEMAKDAVKTKYRVNQESLFEIVEYIRVRVQEEADVQNCLAAPSVTVEDSPTKTVNSPVKASDVNNGHLVVPNQDSESRNIYQDGVLKRPKTAAELEIISGETFVDRRSVFQAHVAPVKGRSDVNAVVNCLKSNTKIAKATHNMVAYRYELKSKNIGRKSAVNQQAPMVVQDHDSDGETAAGGRLQHLLEILDVINVVVVVSRWYGGIPLGPARFRHINNVARQLLVDSKVGQRTEKL